MQRTPAVARLATSGRLAQLGEHLVYTEGVGGSIPSPPMDLVDLIAVPQWRR